MDWAVREIEAALAERAAADLAALTAPPTFRELAAAYLVWLEEVRGAKPSTLRDHGYLLAEPDAPHRSGARKHPGRIMRALGDLPAER